MATISYKTMLSNQLLIFINERIAKSEDMKDKVNSLDEKRKKIFQEKNSRTHDFKSKKNSLAS